jgi:hypothetical protein
MKKLSNKNLFWLTLSLIILCEIISLIGFFKPIIVNIVALLIILVTIFITIKRPVNGFLIILAELLVGSQGYLLWLGSAHSRISLRIALWIIVMGIWLIKEAIKFIKTKKINEEFFNFSYYFPFLLLLISLATAIVIGFIDHNNLSLILTEAKRWLFIITLIPLVIIFKDEKSRQDLTMVGSAAVIWLSFKTLILLYIFSHGLIIAGAIYSWTRFDLLGEITTLANGFSRVFLQSQVYAILAFFFSLVLLFKELINKTFKISKKVIGYSFASALFLAVIIISLSRSFWFGLGLGLLFILAIILRWLRPTIKQFFISLLYLLGVGVLTIIILFITLEFPLPKPLFSFSANLLSDRATTNDAAADSRWSLLPVMDQAMISNPIFGYGLGKTLTYHSSDPRVIKTSGNGLYTTDAFEWGWLDLWLKLGVLGIIAYLWLLLAIFKKAVLKIKTNPYQSLAVIGSILALVGLNVFTPYLNHPLGFGYLAIIMAIL